jgi:hypothetical protein
MNLSMFTMRSFNTGGEPIRNAGEPSEFVALLYYDEIVGYFTSVQAVWAYLEFLGYRP